MTDEDMVRIITAVSKIQNTEKTAAKNYKGFLGSAITVLVVLIGLAVNWGILQSEIKGLRETTSIHTAQLKDTTNDVTQLKIQGATIGSDLQTIKVDIGDIKKDIRVLAKGGKGD